MTNIDLCAELLWRQFWQVSVLLLVVGACSLLLAKKRPHFVFVLWVIFFIKCITPPILQSQASVFAWVDSQPHLAIPYAKSQLLDPSRLNTLPESPATESEPEHAVDKDHQPESDAKSNPVVAPQNSTANSPRIESKPTKNDTATPAQVVPTQSFANSFSLTRQLPRILFYTWATGVASLLLLLVVNWLWFLRKVFQQSAPVPKWLADMANDLSLELGLHRSVRVTVTRSNFGPFAMGWFRPRVVLPNQFLSDEFRENIRSILAHEICHIRRRDPLVNFVQCLAQITFWFHPLVWWARRHANRLCEVCCDEEAIESLKIRRREYAKSLLAVVDAKRLLRPVLATSAMNQAEITKQRLREIMKRKTRTEKTPMWCWLVAAAALLVVLPASGIESANAQDGIPDGASIQAVRSALATGNFDKAEEMCRELIEENDQDALAYHLLGFTLHGAGKLDEAVVFHKKATEFPQTKALGFYNWACVHALQGDHTKAIEKLESAIEAGLQLQTPITSDSDFESMYEDDAFKKIAKRLSNRDRTRPSRPPSANENNVATPISGMKFWVGNWSVVDMEGETVGHNQITLQESGNLIHEKWTSASGSTGQSINYFDPETNKLKQTWVDSKGQVMEMTGSVSSGEVKMKGTAHMKGGVTSLCRMKLTRMDDGRVRQSVELSSDDGETWKSYFDGFYKREEKEKY